MGPSCVLTVVLLLKDLLPTPFKSFSLQKNPLLSEMLVIRFPVSCLLYYALQDPLICRLKLQNFTGNFPIASRPSGQPRPTQGCGEVMGGSVLAICQLLIPHLSWHIAKVAFLHWKMFPMDVTKDKEHLSTVSRTEQASDCPPSTD